MLKFLYFLGTPAWVVGFLFELLIGAPFWGGRISGSNYIDFKMDQEEQDE